MPKPLKGFPRHGFGLFALARTLSSPPRGKNNKKAPEKGTFLLVPAIGLEPIRLLRLRILSQ